MAEMTKEQIQEQAEQQQKAINDAYHQITEMVSPYPYDFDEDSTVLKQIDLNMQKLHANSIVLVGPSGSGKDRIVQELVTANIDTVSSVEDREAGSPVSKNVTQELLDQLDEENPNLKTVINYLYPQSLNGLNSFIIASYIVQEHPDRNYVFVIENMEQYFTNNAQLNPGTASILGSLSDLILSNDNVRVILPLTDTDYVKFHDDPINDLFTKVNVKPMDKKQTLNTLLNEVGEYEIFQNVNISDNILKYAIDQADRYINDKVLPGKVNDLLDTASAARHLKANGRSGIDDKKGTVTKKDINEAISTITNIDFSSEQPIRELKKYLKDNIVGQDEAIDKITEGLTIGTLRLNSDKTPLYSALAFGKSGVGKTLIAQAIAKYITGSEDNLLRLDMSEYKSDETGVARLIGMPVGYRGAESGGQLTEFIKAHPSSIILLDEFEKANAGVQQLFLQILDNGKMKDPKGQIIDFKNTVIIATSNAGISESAQTVGFGNTDIKKTDMNHNIDKLKQDFSPELLNRFNDIIEFNDLNKNDLTSIANLSIDNVLDKIKVSDLANKFKLTAKQRESIIADAVKNSTNGRQAAKQASYAVQKSAAQKFLENEL